MHKIPENKRATRVLICFIININKHTIASHAAKVSHGYIPLNPAEQTGLNNEVPMKFEVVLGLIGPIFLELIVDESGSPLDQDYTSSWR